jgi:preprotein translocase subunit SecG
VLLLFEFGQAALVFLYFLVCIALIVLVLLHSGREAGMGGLGFVPTSQGGTHIVERNLTRVTIVVALIFGALTVVLFRVLD